MSFLIVAIPIIIVILLIVTVPVFLSDSKKYFKHLDNMKQMELDRSREEVLKEVERIKAERVNNDNFDSSDRHRSKILEENDIQTDFDYNKSNINDQSTLKFSKENIVRGLITKEYINRKR